MEKDFHLSLSTEIKLIRRAKRNKFVFPFCLTLEEARLAVVTLHNM